MVTLIAGLGSLGTLAAVANSGGKINHPELRDASNTSGQPNGSAINNHEDDDEDDD